MAICKGCKQEQGRVPHRGREDCAMAWVVYLLKEFVDLTGELNATTQIPIDQYGWPNKKLFEQRRDEALTNLAALKAAATEPSASTPSSAPAPEAQLGQQPQLNPTVPPIFDETPPQGTDARQARRRFKDSR